MNNIRKVPVPHRLAAMTLFAVLALMGCARTPKSVTEYRQNLHKENLPGGAMAWAEYGAKGGQTIVLLHGLPTSSYLYRDIGPILASKGYHVVVPDLFGFGYSDKPEGMEHYTPSAQADHLTELFRFLRIDKASYVVHDLGGLAAWELLGRRPESFERILILNTTAYTKGFTPPEDMKRLGGKMGPAMTGMMRTRVPGKMMVGSFIKGFTARPEQLTADDVSAYWWPLVEGSTEPMLSIARNFPSIQAEFPRYQQYLRSFKGPAMLLWGAKDKVLDYDQLSEQFAADLKIQPENVRRSPDAAHFIQEDQPETVAGAILELMDIARPIE